MEKATEDELLINHLNENEQLSEYYFMVEGSAWLEKKIIYSRH